PVRRPCRAYGIRHETGRRRPGALTRDRDLRGTPMRRGAVRAIRAGAAALVLSAAAGPPAAGTTAPEPNTPIRHFMVLMQENHTFDNYFGKYPGADGIPPGVCMPKDPAIPGSSCIRPWHIGRQPIKDLDHSEPTFLSQLDH